MLGSLYYRYAQVLHLSHLCARRDMNAVSGVLVEDEILTGRRQRKFSNTRPGGDNAFYRAAPNHIATRIDFENVERGKHRCFTTFLRDTFCSNFAAPSLPH